MAIYEYRCEEHGVFDVSRPLGTAPPSLACPACGVEAARVISMPMVLSAKRTAWSAAIERAEKSRHEPEVVSAPPRAGGRSRIKTAPMTPALQRLPRP